MAYFIVPTMKWVAVTLVTDLMQQQYGIKALFFTGNHMELIFQTHIIRIMCTSLHFHHHGELNKVQLYAIYSIITEHRLQSLQVILIIFSFI